MSLETLLDETALNKSARGYLLKNVLAEGSEEIASDLINWAADVLVSKNKSQWRQAIGGYMAQGMGEKEAFQTALKDQIISMGWSGLGGGLSGGVMAGGSIAVNSYLDRGFTMGTEVTQGQKTAAKEGGEMKLSLKEYAGKDLSKDSSIYTYDFLTSLPDMDVTFLPEVSTIRDENGRVDQSIVVRKGMENARSVGTERDGMVFVRNLYTGKQLQITADSIRHGLHGNLNRLLTNAKLGAVIGDVVKNAVPINALENKAKGVSGTYAMAGYATDEAGREFVAIITVEQRTGKITGLEVYDETHAISGRQKRGERVDTKSQGIYPSTNASTINIADFLETVKSTHQSILPQDVLDHFGETRNSGGYYSGETKFSLRGAEEGEDGKGHFTQDDDPLIQDIWRLFGKDGTVDEVEDRPYQGDDPLIQDIWRLFGKDGTVDEAEDRPYQDDDLFIQAIVDMDRGSRFAQEDGTGSGLVYDEYVKTTLPTKTAERVNTIAKALGVRVRFVDSVENGAANASISGTDILVEKGNKNPVLFLLGHEWLHRVQVLASAEYQVFREAIADEISAKAEEVMSLYERYGRSISYEEALDEAAADYAGRMLEDGRLLDEFIERHRTDRTLLERFVEAIREIMGRLTGREKEQARTVEQKLSAALDAAAAQAEALGGKESAATAGGETRYSIHQTADGKKYVKADRQVIFGNDPDSWGIQIEDYINGKIRRGEDITLLTEDGDELKLTEDTAGKASFAYLPDGSRMSDDDYYLKVNAEAHIDELAKISKRGKKTVTDKDGRHGDLAKDGWNYRTAFFQDFDGKYYRLRISVAQGADGNVVYNIGKIRERVSPTLRN